jgi:hypothetical protein
MNIEQAQKRIARLLGYYRKALDETERDLNSRREFPDEYRVKKMAWLNYERGVVNGLSEAKAIMSKIDQTGQKATDRQSLPATPGKESLDVIGNG